MIWLLISVVLLIVLIFFRIDILLVAPIVSVFLCLVSGLDVVDTLAEGFMPAFATFAKNNFLIFMTSAMFARAMQDTGMAASIARGISSKLGPRFAIPCVFFVSALLTYGGVSLFVVVFVVYPIALQLFKEANITRIIIPGAIAAGAFTWAAFCLPGSPQAGPIVATQNLGTNLMVLPWLGVVCAIFMCAMQLVFMNYLHKSAVKKGLGFEADEKTEALISRLDSMKLPNFFISLVPMLVVLITLNVIGLTVYYSMILGVVVALALAWKNVPNKLTMLNSGAQSAIFALINTCAANGFGGVAKLTPGFAQLVQVFTDPTLMSPLVGLGVATTLKQTTGEEVTALLIGSDVAELTDTLIAYGADKVIVAENENLKSYSGRPYQKVVADITAKYKPSIFIFPATAQGRDLAPRVMCTLGTGLTADAVDLGFDDEGAFVQTTPAFGGSLLAHIAIPELRPQMVTVRAHVFDALEPDHSRKGEIIVETVDVEADSDYEVLSVQEKVKNGVAIHEAEVLVAGGRGIKKEEDLDELRELANLIGGEIACSRPLVDDGWLDHSLQIGQSGTTVKPKFILNVGISGSTQYVVGMEKAQTIATINTYGGAELFDVSQYGVVADYAAIIPAIIEEIKARKES